MNSKNNVDNKYSDKNNSERQVLETYNKETLITLYLQIKAKADKYDKLMNEKLDRELLKEYSKQNISQQGKLFETLKTAIENAEWNPEDWTLTYRISEVLDEAKKDIWQSLKRDSELVSGIFPPNTIKTIKEWFGEAP